MKYKIEYTDDLPAGVGGRCVYPLYPLFGTCIIKLRTRYKDDIGILNHELKHAEQYATRWYHTIWKGLSSEYHYQVELEAYTEQIRAYNIATLQQCHWIITALLTKYNLKVSRSRIEEDLLKIMKEL